MTAPLVITVLDESFDTSVFYNFNEEDSNNGNDVTQQEIIPFFADYNSIRDTLKFQKTKPLYFYLDNYTSNALETALPPPEYNS